MRSVLFLILLFSSHCLTMDDYNQCSIRDSCTNLSLASPSIYDNETYIQSRNCFCDSTCQEYGDCCNQSKISNSNYYECIDFLSPTMNKKSPGFTPLSIWMRTKCLSNYIGSSADIHCRNLHNKTFLDDPVLFIPVTSLQTNVTYRNYFCAYCNNEMMIGLNSWEYKAYCHANGSIFDYIVLKKEEQMNYYIQNLTRNCLKTIMYPHRLGSSVPSVFLRPCKQSLPPICPSGTPIDLARKCSSSAPAYRYDLLSHVTYHNPYCAECHNTNHHQITCSDPILHSAIAPAYLIRVHPLSILFDPNLLKHYLNSDLEINSMIYSLAYNCTKSDELYNLFLKQCSRITNSHKELIISMQCSYPIQTLENYIQFNNGSLYLLNQSLLLTKDQYVFLNDHQIIFCADQWKQIIPSLRFPFYRHVLSMVCTSISLLCLLIFAISFCLIPSLHNLPGKCLLFLSISLFLGQLIFFSASDLIHYSSLCLLSAICIHYFYLSSFFWLLIIAIHIHATFTGQLIERDKITKQKYRLVADNILVWCSTGIVIFIACLIQFLQPQSNFSPNYGLIFCSISKSHAMILFFLIPIGCLLFMAAILFFRTILAIYHSHQIAKLASISSNNNQKDNHLVFIYARLASLMGLQWMLLIGALIIQQTWAWIIFEVINSLPGVFICFGFLWSQRIWNDIKQKIPRTFVIRKQSGRSQTTSTSLMPPIRQ